MSLTHTLTWTPGEIWDTCTDEKGYVRGTVQQQENGRWFWHRYQTDTQGYTKKKQQAMRRVVGGFTMYLGWLTDF